MAKTLTLIPGTVAEQTLPAVGRKTEFFIEGVDTLYDAENGETWLLTGHAWVTKAGDFSLDIYPEGDDADSSTIYVTDLNDKLTNSLEKTDVATAKPAPAKKVAKKGKRPAADNVPEFLKQYVYDPALADRYVHRPFPGGVEDFDVLAAQYAIRRPVLLAGPTGAGKTFLVEAFAASLGVPLFTIGGSAGVTEADLYGRYVPVIDPATGDERLEWADGPVTLAARWGGILYVDESNTIPPEITSALHSATDARRRIEVRGHAVPYEAPDGTTRYQQEVIDLHPDCWVVTAGNEGYNGTQDWNQAFKNRFEIVQIDYSAYVESHLIASPALIDFAETLREQCRIGRLYTPVSTVRLIAFERNLYELGYDYAVFSLLGYFAEDERPVIEGVLNDGFSDRICDEYGIDFEDDDVSDLDVPDDGESI